MEIGFKYQETILMRKERRGEERRGGEGREVESGGQGRGGV